MAERGTFVGAFRLEEVIGRGGMGVVHRAAQPGLERDVALKLISPEWADDPLFAERFRTEARLAASVEHPNVLPVYDAGEHDGQLYVAMRLVHGSDLGALVRQGGPLAPERAVRIVTQLAAALDAAHRSGLVHRDVKPTNVLIDDSGGADHVYLTDFGLARLATGGATQTGDGRWAGTVDYAAPEQIRGERADALADVYALGGVLYWALTGKVPFPRDTAEARLLAHLHDPPPRPSAAAPDVPAALDGVVARAMAKRREERFPSAGALAEAAAAALRGEAVTMPAATAAALPSEAVTTPSAAARAPADARTVTAHTAPALATARRPARGAPARRRPLVAATAAALAAAAVGVAALAGAFAGSPDGGGTPPGGDGVEGARAYDVDGNGRQDVAIGVPAARAAVVLTGGRAGATVLEDDAPDGFGAAIAGGDFDRDGYADLAAAARDGTVTVVPGSADGLGEQRVVLRGAGDAGFGTALAAADLDADGFADLAVGVTGDDPALDEEYGSGSIRLYSGGPDGLTEDRARTLRRPRRTLALFGSRLAIGDVDGDGDPDVAEAAAGDPRTPEFGAVPGHATYCPGSPSGPTACRVFGNFGTSGPTALALGDMTGDGRAEILHGVAVARDSEQAGRRPGSVLLWRGTTRGPSRRPRTVTQDSRGVRGNDQLGDEFGAAISAADLDRDGHADLVIGAPGENDAMGRVTLLYGAPTGYRTRGNIYIQQGRNGMPGTDEPGDRFGAGLALLDTDGDNQLDLVATHPGEDAGRGAVTVLPGDGRSFTSRGARVVELFRRVPRVAERPGGPLILGRRAAG